MAELLTCPFCKKQMTSELKICPHCNKMYPHEATCRICRLPLTTTAETAHRNGVFSHPECWQKVGSELAVCELCGQVLGTVEYLDFGTTPLGRPFGGTCTHCGHQNELTTQCSCGRHRLAKTPHQACQAGLLNDKEYQRRKAEDDVRIAKLVKKAEEKRKKDAWDSSRLARFLNNSSVSGCGTVLFWVVVVAIIVLIVKACRAC